MPRFRLPALLLLGASAWAAGGETPTIHIPRVTRPPKLTDFLEGKARQAELKVTDFYQFDPNDGTPISQATTAYLSYDEKNLYVAFVCRDDPSKIRATVAKRKAIMSDDRVTINIDTFDDHRYAYFFDVNPYGIQMDGITTEGVGDDFSFETLWHSEARITDTGYVVLETIPFKSLRFPKRSKQTWGVVLARFIQRNNELACWPHISRRHLPQWVAQFGHLEGIENITHGRNMQFIPYALFGGARFLDLPAGAAPRYRSDYEARGGLDAKVVLKDSFTLDMAANPDFSQVESDEPQVTVNQRFEVFFPEKRPFFMENAGYFTTPEKLFFSRRIADPQFGVRLTGKQGRWGLGALVADDRAPGARVGSEDPDFGRRAVAGVFRLQREFGKDSYLGILTTTSQFGSGYNNVFALDSRIRLRPNLFISGQAISSDTRLRDGTRLNGPAYKASLERSGRHFSTLTTYLDRSPSFRSDLGFIQRVDMRQVKHRVAYRWRPEKHLLVSFGPALTMLGNWNRAGKMQDWQAIPEFVFELPRLTQITFARWESFEDYRGSGFRYGTTEALLTTEWFRWLALQATHSQGTGVNYYPAAGVRSSVADARESTASLTLRPSPRLRLDETYMHSRLATPRSGIFNNHIVRSKVNYQFSRELSLRAILDYNGVLPNRSVVSLDRAKRLGYDVLLTYMLHPGTALYLGATDIYENWTMNPLTPPYLQRSAGPGFNTGRQVFVKLSYLLRY